MHFFSLFTFATIVLSAVFALPVSNPNGIMARDGPASSREIEVLETRGKGSQHKGKKKHVSPAPRSDPHGDSQKQVEEHRKLLKELSVSRGTAADGVVQSILQESGLNDKPIQTGGWKPSEQQPVGQWETRTHGK